MRSPLFIVGNKKLHITEKYDLIEENYGTDYVLLLSAVLSVAGIGRRISSGGMPLPGQEWKQRIKDLLVALFDEGLNPLPLDWMESHISIVGVYKRWIKNHPKDAPSVTVRRSYKRKSKAAYVFAFMALCKHEAVRIQAMGGIQDEMLLVRGHTDQKPPRRGPVVRKSNFPRPSTLVMPEIIDGARQGDDEEPTLPLKIPYSEAELRESLKQHYQDAEREMREGIA